MVEGDFQPDSFAPRDSGIESLVLLLAFHHMPADPAQLRHALGGEGLASADDLVRLARRIGARSSLRSTTLEKLAEAPLPAIAEAQDGGFFVIGGVRDGEILIQAPGEAHRVVSGSELA